MDGTYSEKSKRRFVVKVDNELRLQTLFIFYWIYGSIITSGVNFTARFLGLSGYADIIRGVLVAVMLLFASPAILKYLRPKHVVLYLAVMLVYVSNFIFFPENTKWLQENILEFAFFLLPFIFLGAMLNKMRIPYQALIISSRIIIVFMLMVFLFYSVLENDHEMGRAYGVLMSVMLVTHSMMERWSIWDIATTIAGAIFLLMCATRGPILLYLMFVLLQLLLVSGKHKKLYIFLLGLMAVFALSPLGIQLITSIMERFARRGFNVRIFEYLLSGNIMDDNGRDYLTEKVMDMISQRPLIGNGLYSDRLATSSLSWLAGEGSYVHNIVYELWCGFGYIVGSLLLIALIWMVVRTWKNETNTTFRIIFLSLIITHAGRLLVSSSYLELSGFWICVGLCFESSCKKKVKKQHRGTCAYEKRAIHCNKRYEGIGGI